MRILIACNCQSEAQRISGLVLQHAPGIPTPSIHSLESAADRLTRVMPDAVILVLPESPADGLPPLKDICHTLPGVHVMVVGPAGDARTILASLQAGAEAYLDQAILDNELHEALVRLQMHLAAPAARRFSGKVIACLSAAGGSGASTVAANVAVVLAGKGGSCGLIDLRLAAGDLAAMLGVKPQHTLADLSGRVDRLDDAMLEQSVVRHSSGVHLLAAPQGYEEIEAVTGQAVRRTIDLARARFPYIVIDLDNTFRPEQVEALWQCDVLLLVLRLDYTSLRNARRILLSLAQLGVELDRVRLVVNCYGEPRQIAPREAEAALGMKISHYIPSDRGRINLAVNQGTPVVLQKPSAKVSRTLFRLADSVNGHCPVPKADGQPHNHNESGSTPR